MKTKTTPLTHCLLYVLLGSICVTSFFMDKACAAEDEVVAMIVELVKGSDIDMRVMALQQIRESVPGEDATRRFVELLPALQPDLQLQLIDALGDRGDVAARPAILGMLNSKNEALRAGAAVALAGVASPADIPLLAGMAATGTEPEKKAARASLRRLRGNAMNAAMIEALKDAEAKSKAELIAALVDRDVKEAASEVFKHANDPDLAVRLAVLDAFSAMAGEGDTALVVKRLKAAQDRTERSRAALALVATCRRGQAKCADAVIAGLEGADTATSILLMRALPEAGGPKALNEIVVRLKDKDKRISDEAVRVLTSWPDRSATARLMVMARDVKTLRNHILAIRGLVRLAGPGKDREPDFATLSQTMDLATRKEEKVLVLGALGTIPTAESLTLVASSMDQPDLAEDAGLAAVLIAEKIGQGHRDQVTAVMQKVVKTAQRETTRDRARKVLEAPSQAAALPPSNP
ncbi:MAG: HEAT repeat domain-containing protein [Phycisphaerae bacterium]|nr:HEAT repeat domain-containing protein [Phycisphaerae bacterium]